MGRESDRAHARWFRILADDYDTLTPNALRRPVKAAAALHDLFRRRGPVLDVLDVACGTFSIDVGLVKRGYRVVGRDLSRDMIRVARRNAREAGIRADIAAADMRTLRLGRTFDALACLGTAFNYLASPADIRRALNAFRRHLRREGLLVLDTTNFEAWIDAPMNIRAEVDHQAKDGARFAIFAFNDQDRSRSIHFARFITAVQRGRQIGLAFDEAPLRIWTKETLASALRRHGFQPVEWWGDLRRAAKYERNKSPRLVAVAVRR